jgi:hypothetical protein
MSAGFEFTFELGVDDADDAESRLANLASLFRRIYGNAISLGDFTGWEELSMH